MAQLKDSVVSGNLRVTDEILTNKIQTKVINAPTSSGGSTYGPGSNEQVLKSNGSDTYWGNSRQIYYVKGTQTASTGSWTGILPDISALYDGLTIDYWLPYAGSGNATLNLTLKGGNTTGAINCYIQSTNRLTTHVPQYSICRLVYMTQNISGTNYTGWWLVRLKDDNDTTNLNEGYARYTASSIIYRYQLLFHVDKNILTPLNNTDNNTGTSKTILTNVEFDPFDRIYYYNTTTSTAANGLTPTWTLYYTHSGYDLRWTFNCGQTLTSNSPLYLKLSMQSNGKAKLASASPLTHTLPDSADGYHYLYLGRTYSTYQAYLPERHPIYYHDGTSIKEYTKPESTIDFETQVTNKPILGHWAFMNSNNGLNVYMITTTTS